ncbi:hypothetical protein [Azovibrio restrictus]|uniref:hypothetical protein n=1 Tax=Azovibrio restrictus TaxID=146938 RepID=UPI0026ED68EE|nr:hypothetical protein [Azovibrio restrictus]MDD3483871.1 hypothetical protein [Azovibrio restrictus]
MKRRFLLVLLCTWCAIAAAESREARVEVCFNYGCLSRWPVVFEPLRLGGVLLMLERANSAAEERQLLALAIGELYALAAEQTPIGRDRGGNYADDAAFGRMDCIDHSTTTTAFLKLLVQRGGLHWHRVLEPVRRVRGVVFQHFSAAIEELPVAAQGQQEPPRYVVDSWFVDNGKPAVILPLDAWMEGEGPDVE